MDKRFDAMNRDEYRTLRAGAIWFLVTLLITRVMQVAGVAMSRHFADYIIGRYLSTLFLIFGYSLLLIPAVRCRDWLFVRFAAGAGMLGSLIVEMLKYTVGKYLPRPSGSQGGFPSGHAEASFILAYAIGRRYPRLSIPAYAIAAVITCSRVPYFHFFYQIVGGGILGLLVVVLFDWHTMRRSAKVFATDGG